MTRFVSLVSLVLAFGLLIAACNNQPEAIIEIDESLMSKANKEAICHYQEEKDTYKLLRVGGKAADAHRNHGDAAPGEDVPNMEGYTFGESCDLIAPPPPPATCPCWNDIEGGLEFVAANLDNGDQFGSFKDGIDIGTGIELESTLRNYTVAYYPGRNPQQCEISAEVIGLGNISQNISRISPVPSDSPEATACISDLRALADTLGCEAESGSCPID